MDPQWLIDPERVRKITGSFSWIDHRFISGGFIEDMTREEIPIYLFLVAVSDRQGLSFYHDDLICSLLKTDMTALGEARESLIERSSDRLAFSRVSGSCLAAGAAQRPFSRGTFLKAASSLPGLSQKITGGSLRRFGRWTPMY
jgi:hypothetical protein